MVETMWIVVGLDMLPFSDFRYFVSVLKSFSAHSLKSNAVALRARLLLFGLFFRGSFLFACLYSGIVWEMILPCHLDKIKCAAARRQQAEFVDTLQSLHALISADVW